jgi:hypothetical protein
LLSRFAAEREVNEFTDTILKDKSEGKMGSCLAMIGKEGTIEELEKAVPWRSQERTTEVWDERRRSSVLSEGKA